jgi:DNA-binding Xre family transcriptional regulator
MDDDRAEDAAAIAERRAREQSLGKAAARADYLPAKLVRRLIDGETPLLIWRAHRGLTGHQLAERSGVPQSYISEIERAVKPGSVQALAKLARALGVSVDDLVVISQIMASTPTGRSVSGSPSPGRAANLPSIRRGEAPPNRG